MIDRRRVQEVRLLLPLAAVVGALACGTGREPAPASFPSQAAPSRTAPTHLYVVREGDSLGAIAACAGVSVDELVRMNRIPNPDRISSGARLRLPEGHPCLVPPPRRVVRAPRRTADPLPAVRAQAERSLAIATAQNEAADFEAALSSAETCVQKLAPYGRDAKAKQIGSRCHVVAGMAAAGLDRRERAIQEFRHAFALDPGLKLAPETTSPRILELVSAAQPKPAR